MHALKHVRTTRGQWGRTSEGAQGRGPGLRLRTLGFTRPIRTGDRMTLAVPFPNADRELLRRVPVRDTHRYTNENVDNSLQLKEGEAVPRY
eukprot:3441196-Pleurochrysis_carterae.AAC.1